MSDVEYIIQVQQNYVITQENALEAIKSFEGEAESLTLIKVSLFLPLLCAMVKCHHMLASRQLRHHGSRPTGPFFPRKF